MILPIQDPSNSVQEELEKRGWALSALSAAAAALARADSTDMLIAEVCDAIATQSPYLLAWVGKAEDDQEKTIKVLGGAGSALAYLNDIAVSWSAQHVIGLGPAGVAVRTNQITIVADTDADPGFIVWQDLAKKYGIRSAIACPIADGAGHPFGV